MQCYVRVVCLFVRFNPWKELAHKLIMLYSVSKDALNL